MLDSSADQTPEAYKRGWIDFYGMPFDVTKDVLIPRPETEMITDEVKNFLKQDNSKSYSIVDVGTGSGAIAITLGKLFPLMQITAIDVSQKALAVARRNANKHRVENINFQNNDLLKKFNTPFDIVVANLPYIPHSRLAELDSSVIDFEPVLALDGGSDGFDLYRKMFSQITAWDKQPKLLVCEIDDTHGSLALTEAENYFPNSKVLIKKDFSNFDRLLVVLN
jgi:release factor glutamine methyltransferase